MAAKQHLIPEQRQSIDTTNDTVGLAFVAWSVNDVQACPC
jgi:hypothetical protein